MPHTDAPETLTLCIRPDGSIEALHDEALDLAALGPMSVVRASHVEYDDAVGRWYVEDAATGRRLFEHLKRSTCIQSEVQHFGRALAAGLRPFDLASASRGAPQPAADTDR